MLLKAILFIPTLFTYGIILLLIIILSFLVVYISHKIYISIYDNLPLPTTSRLSPLPSPASGSTRSSQFLNQPSMRSIWITNRPHVNSSKAVRIIITLESCYLAYIEVNASATKCRLRADNTCVTEPSENPVTIIKYYDHLSKIPKGKVCLSCTQHLESGCVNMRSMIDSVINNAMSEHMRLNA